MTQDNINKFTEVTSDILSRIKQTRDSENISRVTMVEKKLNSLFSGLETLRANNSLLTIGIVGQMKVGKSSFLNALLFEGEAILPKAATPMTAGLTVIEKSPEEGKSFLEVEYYTKNEWDSIGRTAEYVEKIRAEILHENPMRVNEDKKLDAILKIKVGELDFASYEIVKKKIDNYIQLHEVIQSTITDHVNLLHDYLSDPMYIKDENPVNAFISKNSEKMNNADVLKKIPLEIKTLPKTYEKKSMVITSKKVDECAGLIKNNKDDYSSIQINSLTKEEFEKIFQKIPKNEGGEEVITPEAKLNELRKLKIKRCNLEEIELNQYFPNIESLKMKYCPYIYGNFNCVRYLSKIQKLVLRNLNLTTNTFEAIIDALLNNDEARNHLKYLSCANNKITKVCMIRENSRQFSELKELDFEENKIYKIRRYSQ